MLITAFNQICAWARRYWGFDVEHLNSTIRLMQAGIKAVSWLTLVGDTFLSRLGGSDTVDRLNRSGISATRGHHGFTVTAGPVPDILDQNRPSQRISSYSQIATVLSPVFLPEFPGLPGRFMLESNSSKWFRRFLDSDGWRR
jgi:hypothetical protein